jgi:hypothetical protein
LTGRSSLGGFGTFAAALLLVAYCALIFLQERRPLFAGSSDFSSLYVAGRLVVMGEGSHVYDREAQWRIQSQLFHLGAARAGPLIYNHAPFELLIFAPLAALPYAVAITVWYVLNVALLVWLPFLFARSIPLLAGRLWLAFFVLALFFPVNIALLQGQDSILLLVLFSLSFLWLSRGDDVPAGCMLALATFKPHLVLPLLLIVALLRKWKVIAAFLGTGVILGIVSSMLVGWRTVLQFPLLLWIFNRLAPGVAGAYPDRMPNLRGLIEAQCGTQISPSTLLSIILLISGLVILMTYLVCARWDGRFTDLTFALVLLVDLLVAYHLNIHDLALLVLPILLIANYVASQPLTNLRMALGLAAGSLLVLPALLPPGIIAAILVLLTLGLCREALVRAHGTRATAQTVAGTS